MIIVFGAFTSNTVIVMSQHFLLSPAAKIRTLAHVMRMSNEEAETRLFSLAGPLARSDQHKTLRSGRPDRRTFAWCSQ